MKGLPRRDRLHVKRSTPPALAYLERELDRLAEAGLLRERPSAVSRPRPSFCSNDYLGLTEPTAGGPPNGAGASRLVAGEQESHVALEKEIAGWLRLDDALVFTSGYAANVGTLPALAADAADLVLSDALNHASLVDGCRLARAETQIYPHLDLGAVERLLERGAGRRIFVVTESYFSMDADAPDLGALRRLCDRHGAALVVDEAHALGVLGPEGRGLLAAAGVAADVTIGTLGKALGAGGAFVAGGPSLIAWLWNRARSFVFSTGLSPLLCEAARSALLRSRADTTLRTRALARASELRSGLGGLGLEPLGFGHIVPWVVGDASAAVRIAQALRAKGLDVQAIRPPSVPPGTARLRFTASAMQSPEDVERLIAALRPLVS
jgi:8-amino-7-oxononanoate synthase